jgi:hypothetical protein
MKLLLLGAETRAGQSTIDALHFTFGMAGSGRGALLYRHVASIHQSIELDRDIGDTLRAF